MPVAALTVPWIGWRLFVPVWYIRPAYSFFVTPIGTVKLDLPDTLVRAIIVGMWSVLLGGAVMACLAVVGACQARRAITLVPGAQPTGGPGTKDPPVAARVQ